MGWFSKKKPETQTAGGEVYVNPSPDVSSSRNNARIDRLKQQIERNGVHHPDNELLQRELTRRIKIRELEVD